MGQFAEGKRATLNGGLDTLAQHQAAQEFEAGYDAARISLGYTEDFGASSIRLRPAREEDGGGAVQAEPAHNSAPPPPPEPQRRNVDHFGPLENDDGSRWAGPKYQSSLNQAGNACVRLVRR